MQDRDQFQLDAVVLTLILLTVFCIISAGFLFGVLVGTVSIPADLANAVPFLLGALLILALGVALTAFVYWSIQGRPQIPVQSLRRVLVTHTTKRSSQTIRRD